MANIHEWSDAKLAHKIAVAIRSGMFSADRFNALVDEVIFRQLKAKGGLVA